MMLKTAVVIITLVASQTWASKHCCPNNKTYTLGVGCAGKTKIDFKCKNSVVLLPGDEINIDPNENLLLGDSVLPPDEFCEVYEETSNKTITKSYMICYNPEDAETSFSFLTVLSFVSAFFLVLTIIIYLWLTHLLDLQGICMIHSITGLAISFLLLGINQSTLISSKELCITIGSIVYVSFLYAFFWLNITSFHIWRTTVKSTSFSKIHKWILIYHSYGILGPLAFLIFLLVGNHGNLKSLEYIHPGIGEGSCWFVSLNVQFIYFYGPITILICINIIFFIWTIVYLCRNMNNADERKKKVLAFRFKLCIKLFIIMGLSWIFEVLSGYFTHKSIQAVWLVTDTINASEGILIFLILVVFRKRVLRDLANKKYFNYCLPSKWKLLQNQDSGDVEEAQEYNTTQIDTPNVELK